MYMISEAPQARTKPEDIQVRFSRSMRTDLLGEGMGALEARPTVTPGT